MDTNLDDLSAPGQYHLSMTHGSILWSPGPEGCSLALVLL